MVVVVDASFTDIPSDPVCVCKVITIVFLSHYSSRSGGNSGLMSPSDSFGSFSGISSPIASE